MSENNQSVNETIEVIDAAVGLFNRIKEVKAETSAGGTEVTTSEYLGSITLAPVLFSGISGIQNVPAELGDELTDEEEALISAAFEKANVDVDADKKKEFINEHLHWLAEGQALLKKYYLK
jgi:hypothetical protein